MPTTYAPEVAGLGTVPATKSNGGVQGGRVRRFRATIPYEGQASGDDIVLASIPAGYTFMYGVLTATASAGTATVAIGVAGATGKYRTAATFTAANTPTMFGNALAVGETAPTDGLTVLATLAIAALPTSANSLVVDLYFSAP
jgi:hypothetical protein